MPGTDYTRMDRAAREKTLLGIAASTWPWDIQETAQRGILGYNDLFALAKSSGQNAVSTVTWANFKTYVTTLAGYLNVTMPVVPEDLNTLSDAQLLTLLQSMELAFWDWNRRVNALNNTLQFYRQAVTAGVTPPAIIVFRDTFLDFANASRAARGLTALVA